MGTTDFHQNFNLLFDGLQMHRHTDNRTEQMKLHSRIGVGSVHRFVPRSDVGLAIAEFKLHHDSKVNFHTEVPMVELSYCLEGTREIQVAGVQYEVAPGSYTLQFANPAEASMYFNKDQSVNMLSIGISVSTFHHFVEETGGARSVEFDRIIGEKPYRMFQETIDPATFVLLKHMMQSARGQGIRNLEIECKILELMSLAFGSFLMDDKPASTKLSRTDMAKIEQARAIILEQMTDPPSLMDLSRLIGLNDYKLKIGFKEMYGRTVFGYLKDQRLEKAYRLLQNGSTSVIEVSYAVGYSNPSYFAEVFREKYGFNPGQFVRRPLSSSPNTP
ncbi:AraC family transcriptional regulator [Paenibacillus sp. H1-7]|uniref:helix-turn-helix domain-containing protein n=1 Tax=Paenibacillus sp. H1-7 TaxID=2282849 RepID=UPI001EF8DE0D|nr:AraC family transcriptional regulator [Paenibacillus sp. H1-7]ULL16637.1 AraC family transcriptional regulator [Paenibacillus sp. H1-7]